MQRLVMDKNLKYILLAPSLLLILFLGVYPMVEAIYTSLTRYELTNPALGKPFVGLRNYINMVKDFRFWAAVGRSIIFALLSVGFSLLIGFFIAYLLHRIRIGKDVLRTIFLVPMVIAPAIVALNFKFMYSYDVGVINYFISLTGLPRQQFLGDPNLVLGSLILVDIWQWTPFVILVLLAGLESLPNEPFEAAMIDGAGTFALVRYVTVPLLKRFLTIALLIRVMDALKVYETIYLMTVGGPGTASETLNVYVGRVGFSWFNLGYASAMAIFALYFAIFIAMIFIRYVGAFGRE